MVILPDGNVNKVTQQNMQGDGGTGSSSRRPRPPAIWSCEEVVLWFERHLNELGSQYSMLFKNHNVTGRALLKINESALERMGIVNDAHRELIWREIIKLKLKADMLELRLLVATPKYK